MADFNPNPYRGEESIPHVSEDFFKVYFMGAQVRIQYFCAISELFLTKHLGIVPRTAASPCPQISMQCKLPNKLGSMCKFEQNICAAKLYAQQLPRP